MTDCLGLLRIGQLLLPNRPSLTSTQLTNFFWTLESVLSYRATIIKVFEDMGRFTVNKVALSTKDVLVLLYKWSLMERDTKLQGGLRAVIEQHQVKDLMSKFQPCLLPLLSASTWSSLHAVPQLQLQS